MKVRNCIVVCDSASHSGGVSAVILEQVRGLQARGIAVHVFAAFGPADPALRQASTRVHCVYPQKPWPQLPHGTMEHPGGQGVRAISASL